MKIAILGTRGIPNSYGGFEQLAEDLSVALTKGGHELSVYQSSTHPFKPNNFKGVNLVRCYDPSGMIGTAGQFIYDLNSLLHARKQKYDIILQLGYTSSSIWSFLLPQGVKIINHMDGLEWKREKYNSLTKSFLKFAERLAVESGDVLISDSPVISSYLEKTYSVKPVYIAYGAEIPLTPDESILKNYGLSAQKYYLAIARFEPENNPEAIIQGYLESGSEFPLMMIGSTKNRFGTLLKKKFENERIRFPGALYAKAIIDSLRHYSLLYFHGHSAGGTNPSLLEAMAAGANICAHENPFNRAVLGEDALFFSSSSDIASILKLFILTNEGAEMRKRNLEKIRNLHQPEFIINCYNNLFVTPI